MEAMKKVLIVSACCLLGGCSRSIVIDMPMTKAADTTEYIPIERNDTTETSGVPIGFDVAVEDWEGIQIEIEI